MGYWKSKVLPKIQKVFGKDPAKKAAALEAIKSFDESKEVIIKEFEEKQGELQPKVIEIYEASSVEIKSLVKEPTEAGLKKHSAKVQTFLDELVKIEFPGSKSVSETSSKVGPALVPGPVIFILEKVSTFIPKTEEPPVEAPPAATTEKEKAEEEEVVAGVEARSAAEAAAVRVREAAAVREEPAVIVEEVPKPVEEPPATVAEPVA